MMQFESGHTPIVKLKGVNKSFRSGEIITPVLRGIDTEIAPNSFNVILGASGSGKTTLLNIIGGLDSADSGSVVVDSEELTNMTRSELNLFRRNKIGFIFQFYNLLPSLDAEENVAAGLEVLPLGVQEIQKRCKEYLKKVGLGDKLKKFPGQLSGGEQQRVAIARALAREPALILADEPTGNLDTSTSEKIFSLMRNIQKDMGVTFIVVSHNQKLKDYADRILYIENGKIIE